MTEVVIKENENGEPYIEFPTDIIDRLGWQDGDNVEFIDNKNGSITVRKIEPGEI